MGMIWSIVLLVIWFVLLIKGADLLVSWASSIARKFHISELIIGLTIVAFGTSLPELVVNVQAAVGWSTDIAIGNILWSNLSNILLVIGVTSIIAPLPIHQNTRTIDIPFMTLIVLIFALLVASPFVWEMTGLLDRSSALILLLVFGIFLYYLFFDTIAPEHPHIQPQSSTMRKSFVFILLWLVGLTFGGDMIVDSAQSIAASRGMSERLIGLTVIALGTSLPELATSVTAALKGKSEIAIGNIVWSNIFNIGMVLGITGVVYPLSFSMDSVTDLIAVIVASVLLFLSVVIGRRELLERYQGIIFVALYVWYMGWMIIVG